MATLHVPATVVKAVERELGTALTPAVTGQEARVFFTDGRVVKIYGPHEKRQAELEAKNLARAGLGDWVLAVLDGAELADHAALVLRRFPGRPFDPLRFDGRALARLAGFVVRLHRLPEPGVTLLEPILERLRAFRRTLADLPEAQAALDELEPRLPRLAGVRRVFAHNDLWAGNVLVAPDGAVLVVDWSRAGGEDPARDLAILTTGTLSLLPHERCLAALAAIVRRYPDPLGVWSRLAVWIPFTFLHDLHWFREKEPENFEAARADKLPRIERALHAFPKSPW